MCNDLDGFEHRGAPVARGVTRRKFAVISAATVVGGCAIGRMGLSHTNELTEKLVGIATSDGNADAFLVHPAEGSHPAVIIWPDAIGLREVKKALARRLAASGYAVLVVNCYYRDGPAPLFTGLSDWVSAEGQARFEVARSNITSEGVVQDTRRFVDFLDGQKAVDKRRGMGVHGYCLGGPFAVRSAAAVPSRVQAVGSFHHGDGMIDTKPDSPHRLLAMSKASYLIAIARNDDAREPREKDELRKAADAAGRRAEIEVYPADHGWCVADVPPYDPVQAERAWTRLLALYSGL